MLLRLVAVVTLLVGQSHFYHFKKSGQLAPLDLPTAQLAQLAQLETPDHKAL
jgi:hypothetical protein